jgi:DNA invertase Pin-like site-specific DNA recombinase
MFGAINGMLLDLLAAISRKDYDDRRRRAAQGIEKARAAGKYRGRPPDEARNAGIAAMLKGGTMSWSEIQAAAKCSRATVAKISRKIAIAAE